MALLDYVQRNSDNTKSPTSPSLKRLQGSKWLPTSSSPTFRKDLDPEDFSTTPSWVVRLDDDEDEEDDEFFKAPAFESKLAPEGYKETTRHNPRAIHKNFGKHDLESTVNLTIKKKNRCLQILKGH
ncbi:hypothetical protein CMV_029244 [Castanea mollissima]|uniref:Uncharacterized protein n=1 Tax=Castanea mollissima TaxID=60419 RepID=A0A8J4QBN0_9ROSI|nr:hypothetical protein CMV_029244 [Castanea mollissima]